MAYGLEIETQNGLEDISEKNLLRAVHRIPWSGGDPSGQYTLDAGESEDNCIVLGVAYDGLFPPGATILNNVVYYGDAGTIIRGSTPNTANGEVIVFKVGP